MSEPWPMVRLGELLNKSEEWITLSPETTYREVTVRLWGKGVALRREALGAEIVATQRLVVRANQFILSRIDARNGASGLIPDSLDGAIVSNDFPVFSVKTSRLLPEYLGWLTKTSPFIELCKAASEGTTNRVRLKEDRFLATRISLPPLPEQRRIVARIEALAARIAEAKRLREETTTEAQALLKVEMRRVFSADEQFPKVHLEAVCAAIIDTIHSDPRYTEEGVPCVRSPDVKNGRLDLTHALKTDEVEYVRRTIRGEPKTDDIVFVRQGGGTGKAGIVEYGERFSLGQAMMILRPDRDKVLPRFLLHQLRSPIIRDDQIKPCYIGTASPRINIGSLRKFLLYIPLFAEQRRIVAHLDALQAKVDALRVLQAESASELDALLPAVLAQAFRGEL